MANKYEMIIYWSEEVEAFIAEGRWCINRRKMLIYKNFHEIA